MSALEELWLWLRGRSSQTETGPEALDSSVLDPQEAVMDASIAARKAELAARVQRNSRYRAGPWQMK
jgi:hypothetical protein